MKVLYRASIFARQDALFCLSIIASLFLVLTTAQHSGNHAMAAPHIQESEKVTSMTFSEHDDYKNLTHEYDSLWDDLLPPNGGFFRKHYKNGQIHGHGVSMFHQLHCLAIMRSAYQSMEEKLEAFGADGHGREDGHHSEASRAEASPKTHEHLGKGHWLHCFDYLRQAILCNADATVEVPLVDKNGDPVVDGMVKRKCNDWTALWDAAINSDRMSDVQ